MARMYDGKTARVHVGAGPTKRPRPATAPVGVQAKPAGCCGPVKSRLEIIRKVHEQVSWAHSSLATLYTQLAREVPEDRADLLKAAEKQTELAKLSLTVTVPGNFSFDDEVKP
jgi:hypothetical protein